MCLPSPPPPFSLFLHAAKILERCGKIIRRKKVILVPTRLPRNTGMVSVWFSFLAKRRIPRRDRNVAEVRSTLSFRCLFNGRGREKRRKVIICGQPSCEMTFTDSCIIHARLFADPHFANLLPHFLRSPTLSPRVVENNWRGETVEAIIKYREGNGG